MQFDIVMGNPPYGSDMDFLRNSYRVLKEGGELQFLHPSTPFISLKQGTRKKKQNVVDEIKDSIVSLTFMNNVFEGGDAGGVAEMYVPISITYLKKGQSNGGKIKVRQTNGTVDVFDGIEKVNVWGNKPEIFSLIKKAYNVDENVWTHALSGRDGSSWYVEFPWKKGNPFYSIIKKSGVEPIAGAAAVPFTVKGEPCCYGFKTKGEAENFISYLRTQFVLRLLSFWKVSQNLHRGELAIIPWLDFSKRWDDESLINHFNLDADERTLINTTFDQLQSVYDSRKIVTKVI